MMNSHSFIRPAPPFTGIVAPKTNGNSIWSYSVVVITLDFESENLGSNPGKTFFNKYL
jgi:hypothetical protein